MFACWPSRLSAHAFALAGSLFCVSQVLIAKWYFLLLALICLTRILAAARAGLSNGDMLPDWSYAQPMITFFFAAGAAWLPVVPARAAIATAAASSAARMPHLVARPTALLLLGKHGRETTIQDVTGCRVNPVPRRPRAPSPGGRAPCAAAPRR